jgi:predicted nucleic acid-binding protein
MREICGEDDVPTTYALYNYAVCLQVAGRQAEAATVLQSLYDTRLRILGPGQITDVYLLALAVRHGGRLVTFDRGVPIAAVKGAKPEHLVSL